VFGALGILAVYQLVTRLRESGNNYRAWVPLGAGLALLGLLGSGAHTDIMAHLLGFSMGGLIGVALKQRMGIPPGPRVQMGALLLSAAVFIFAWRLAWPGSM
jgi:alpha-beta hydrolase superfamily lysophospholipase